MVARERQRCRLAPGVGFRIVDHVRVHRLAVRPASGDHVDFACDGGRADTAERHFQRGAPAPGVGRGIVFLHVGACALMHGVGETAEGVNLVVGDGDPDVIARERHGIALAPGVGRGIILGVVRHRGAADVAADRIKFAADRGSGHLGARGRHRRSHRPYSKRGRLRERNAHHPNKCNAADDGPECSTHEETCHCFPPVIAACDGGT